MNNIFLGKSEKALSAVRKADTDSFGQPKGGRPSQGTTSHKDDKRKTATTAPKELLLKSS